MLKSKGKLAKGLAVVTVVALLAVAVVFIGFGGGTAFAEPPTPGTPYWGSYGFLDWGTIQRVAIILGTTPKELVTGLQEGKTLAQIAQDKGISKDKLVDTIVLPYKDQLDGRVRYGYLTPARADSLLKRRKTQVEAFVSQPVPETALAPYAEGEEYYDGYCPMHGASYGLGMMGGGYGWSGAGMMGGFGSLGYGTMGSFGSDTRDSTAGSGPTAWSSFGRFGSGMMGRGWR